MAQIRCPFCDSKNIANRTCKNCQTVFPEGASLRQVNVGRISNTKRHYTTMRPSDRPTSFTNLEPAS